MKWMGEMFERMSSFLCFNMCNTFRVGILENSIDGAPKYGLFNPLAYTAACEAAGVARSINTQPAVRRNSETNPTSQYNRGMY
jgi:hypothetical protein